eukprot:TRINITY_DN2484_c4_g1_i1.p1 TRINITY_DN2484_c4_g1~~TRINITY_DN2484_c4_g1_i1.p1  ORF type:complete len:919 (-),score=250.00 TRINITY_DN2484_c4_g1_i1:28-2784(-)
MASRDLASILGDIIRRNRCPEVVVEYSCGHTVQPEVQLPVFLADKREPRVAARALRVACRKGSPPLGEDGIFRIEVPGGPYQQQGCSGAAAGKGAPAVSSSAAGGGSEAGHRTALRCGAVSMDLVSACEAAENPIPVGIAAGQFANWVQLRHTEEGECQRIQLTSCMGTQTWWQFFTTPGSFGPVLIAMVLWLLGCVAYAAYAAPQIPMVSPELFYRQVQEQIENIPVPKHSPHYAHYRQYYLQQYQEHLKQYRDLEADWKANRGPMLHWGALLQGLGLGTWFFVAILAFCEYQYTTVTTWMELIEEHWAEWRRSRTEKTQEGRKAKSAPHGGKDGNKANLGSPHKSLQASKAASEREAEKEKEKQEKLQAESTRESGGMRAKLQQKLNERQRKKYRAEVAAAVAASMEKRAEEQAAAKAEEAQAPDEGPAAKVPEVGPRSFWSRLFGRPAPKVESSEGEDEQKAGEAEAGRAAAKEASIELDVESETKPTSRTGKRRQKGGKAPSLKDSKDSEADALITVESEPIEPMLEPEPMEGRLQGEQERVEASENVDEEGPKLEEEEVCVQEAAAGEDEQEGEDEAEEEEEEEEEEVEEEEMEEDQENEEEAREAEAAEDEAESWQVVTKQQRPKSSVPEPRGKESAPPKKEEADFKIPKNPETLSTDELVALLQVDSVRRQLLRRGAPIREQLVRWFQELNGPRKQSSGARVVASGGGCQKQRQEPSSSSLSHDKKEEETWDPAGILSEPKVTRKTTRAPWAKAEENNAEEGRITMRAEAPEFVPTEMPMMPAGTVLVPCVLPPSQDGSISVPAGHVVVMGAMGLPEGVPLIVPVDQEVASLDHVSSQFDASAFNFNMPLMDVQPVNPVNSDFRIVDASTIGLLNISPEDHVAAAVAAAEAAAAHGCMSRSDSLASLGTDP